MLIAPARPLPTVEDRRVWSIRQVYEDSAKVFIEGSNTVQNILLILMRLVNMGENPNAFITGELAEELSAQVGSAKDLFDTMGARATRDACKRTMEYLETPTLTPVRMSEIMISLQAIKSSYYDELASWHVLFLNEREAAIFDHGETTTFGQEVIDAFPSAVPNMVEACKCFALNRWTATTYHCMGVLEAGIRGLCRELSVTIDLNLSDATWNKMQNAIAARITPQGNAGIPRKVSHAATWPEDEIFFNEALQDIRMLGKAYRNPTMHFRSIAPANEGQARRVLEGTAAFMRSLSEKVKE